MKRHYGASGQLGIALQLCALRFLGFIPDDLGSALEAAIDFLARQLGVSMSALADYGRRNRTRSDHAGEIGRYLGFRQAGAEEWKELERWLIERAMEHDRPTLLLELLSERLYAMNLIRPGVTRLERAVSGARQQAQKETWRKIEPLLGKEDRKNLDGLLGVEEEHGVTPLNRFRTGETSHSAGAILNALEKIAEMRALGVEEWKLSEFNPNRLKLLARIGKRATNQALERMPEERRYPILVAFLSQTFTETIDEAVDLFDRCLAEADSRASRSLDEFRKSVAKATNEKVNLFQTIGRIILDPEVKDSEVRRLVYQHVAPDQLRAAVDECERIARPPDDS